MPTAEQVLDTAAQILTDPNAWHKGNWHSEDGMAHCSLGAIEYAYRQHGVTLDCHEAESPAGEALQDVLRDRYPTFKAKNVFDWFYPPLDGDTVIIARWNDAEDRTHAEVLEAFEKARAYAAEKGL